MEKVSLHQAAAAASAAQPAVGDGIEGGAGILDSADDEEGCPVQA